ncbi:MAG: pyruvate, phosphate dikinase [Candidatus Hadarchaeum yellowstonense]|uniref:pyruvate, phosphate dikinase n=1 Tax=Hadarchaeum yellowstonense TaxID=1776334 RepID=A0A147JTA6_HADYE|nr:MAG: pyruvate, phosphate dikinase [Candidatus Hadarchaeum yellowstonense]
MAKRLYFFDEGDGTNKRLLGGKGAGLCTMAQLGLPVPPGFVITTEVCKQYYDAGGKLPAGLMDEVMEAMKKLERITGKGFGDPKNPLLVSIRSGSMYSMPGMMDTILNLGLNDETVEGLAKLTNNERFAYDAYRRFIQMFGKIVLGVDGKKFEEIFEEQKKKVGAKFDTDLTATDLKEIVKKFKQLVKEETHQDFPSDPVKQLELAIGAVFASWQNKRAIEYRRFYKIPDYLGTAVNVVTMVFGNIGEDSGTGVAFTRDPSTGERKLFGEFLFNAQGEDVVAGIRTPLKIDDLKRRYPEIYNKLVEIAEKLERHYRDMQDIEFTVERGKLYMLQTRAGKRTAQAAVKIAVDMVMEGLITKEEALLRIEPSHIEQLLHKQVDPQAKVTVIAKGLNASPGAAVGKAVFDSERAKEMGKAGEKVILVRPETSPDDVGGIIASQGVLTSRGGVTSHAAVVTRGLGKPAVVGCESIKIDVDARLFEVDGTVVKEGDLITINGTTGEVILGAAPLIEPKMSPELLAILSFADEVKKLQNWANADYPRDARKARELGAQGIGLCRTEHMFFEEDRLPLVHEMILAETKEERQKPLEKLLQIQKNDFKEILEVMDGLPVIIRLLDPPLHEFLPRYEKLLEEVIELRLRGSDPEKLREKEELLKRVEGMREANPMMGLRGCRLGIIYPEINEMQVRAIFEAACELKREGKNPKPEIMIPLVGHVNELKLVREQLEKVAHEVMQKHGVDLKYKFGTMIEVPRAALTADEIAEYAEFFSFGTNDLTQMVYAYSRDDAEGRFLFQYIEKGILEADPFQRLDRKGVGKLMKIAVELGRGKRPDLEIGICGEHGGDPSSIEFCHELGLNYVSCSPFRIPVARLAAAHAALKSKEAKSYTVA